MRLAPLLLSALLLTACKPSDMFGPGSRQDELDGGFTDAAPQPGTYPTGWWEDGLGNAWDITVTGTGLSGKADSENIRGLLMTGTIRGDVLTYDIGFADQEPIANGTAHLTDDEHARFETLNADGTLNAHGLLHFNHSAQVPISQPMDLRPQINCAGQGTTGD
jgi:hypothetical protein